LPLQSWEVDSLEGLMVATSSTANGATSAAANTGASTATISQSTVQRRHNIAPLHCEPPVGIPSQCCLGTFSGMARIVPNAFRQQCAHVSVLQQMTELHNAAMEYNNNNNNTHNSNQGGCDVCYLLEYLREQNKRLTILGDSVSHQTFQGLVCELYRRQYHVEETSRKFHNPNQQSQGRRNDYNNNKKKNKRRGRRQQQQQQQDNATDANVILTQCQGLNHCLHLVRTIRVTSPLWQQDQTNNGTINPVVFHFYHQYRLPFADPKQQEMVMASGDILLLNFGLHWGANYHGTQEREQVVASLTSPDHPPSPQHLELALASFFKDLDNYTKRSNGDPKRVLVRETTSQHFDAPGGDYSFVKKKTKKNKKTSEKQQPLECVPYVATGNNTTTQWREQAIFRAAHMAGYSLDVANGSLSSNLQKKRQERHHVTVLPYADFTKPLHGLHPYEAEGKGGDCTHYCSTPYLFLPLWKSLRLALVQ